MNLPIHLMTQEAVVNAVYHRDYTVREPIEIRIYEDEILILSYPRPDRSVKLEVLQKGRANSRRYRNRRIGEFFKELKMTEGRSTGINKILDAMAKNGSPKAEFEFDEEHTYFQVKLPMHGEVLKECSAKSDLTPEVKKLLESIKDEMNTQEIMNRLDLKDEKHFRNNYRKPAIELGLVELTIPDKPRSSKQRYRLTPLGKKVFKDSK